MLFPTHDDNEHASTPVITYLIILVCVLAFMPWFFVDDLVWFKYIYKYGFVSAEIFGEPLRPLTQMEQMIRQEIGDVAPPFPQFVTLFTSMFMHADFFHIAGNLWFLTIFADNVEHAMGKLRFTVFFLLTGAFAFAADVPINGTDYLSAVGASGAISAIMGAYMVYYPRSRIHMILILIPPFFHRFTISAFWMIGLWFGWDFFMAWLNAGTHEGGVDFWAHVGGFMIGALLAKLFRDPSVVFIERRMMTSSQRRHVGDRPRR